MGEDLAKRGMKIDREDNVAVALEDLTAGDAVMWAHGRLTVRQNVARGHKFALRELKTGEAVLKYGFPIGHATASIGAGDWVHGHNLATNLTGKIEYAYQPIDNHHPVGLDEDLPDMFLGYMRANGTVGIRNEIWIINTVGCINKAAERLAALADRRFAGLGVDGVYHFAHPYGCSQLGDDLAYTKRCLAGLVRHPNAAGVLVLGLGCETNRIDVFSRALGDYSDQRVKFLSLQQSEDELAEGMELIEELVAQALSYQRQPIPVSRLKIGLKCGGSDGFSGITANPVVGAVADRVIDRGGTALLTEVPEMFGAETILMQRAKNRQTFSEIVDLIDGFKAYYERHGEAIYENPSPGNKDGGITTLEEKSLGCIQKGGTRPVAAVLDYGQASLGDGLELVDAPGNDMVSVTALAAAGAHLVLFTTGRGTPLGGPVPTLKISTTSELAAKKPNWIDFDAGRSLAGQSVDSLASDLYRSVIEVASGRRATQNESNGYREIAIFKDGVTL
jgi:altronate hydrolase